MSVQHISIGELSFPDKETCDTEEEALILKERLGSRWRSTHKVTYPDCEFWIVEFEAEPPHVSPPIMH